MLELWLPGCQAKARPASVGAVPSASRCSIRSLLWFLDSLQIRTGYRVHSLTHSLTHAQARGRDPCGYQMNLFLSLSLSLSHTHTYTHTLTDSLTHTLTHRLEGEIPEDIRWITGLTHLDLTFNQMEGGVPPTLARLVPTHTHTHTHCVHTQSAGSTSLSALIRSSNTN